MSKFLSGALVLVVAFLAIWGQCAACPLIAPQKNNCCDQHSGHCQMPTSKQESQPPCPDQALAPVFHHQAAPDLAQLLAPAPAAVAAKVSEVLSEPALGASLRLDASPPDLYLLDLVLRV